MGLFISAILGLGLGFAAGWYLRRRGEDYRKQALEATHGEFLRAAGLARDRARGEAEDLEQRFQRFRLEHDRSTTTIGELRETVARLESKLSGHDSSLAEARSQLEDQEARIAVAEKGQAVVQEIVSERELQAETRVRELERELAERETSLTRLSREMAEDHEAHAGCAGTTQKLEARIEELEQKKRPGQDGSPAEGPRWLLSRPNGAKDDLTAIRGLGPILEKYLNSVGIFHFNQLARLQPQDIEWLAKHIRIFPGRVRKDKWVEQAKRMQSRTAGPDH